MESLTGFSFPRATGLCTRYATQITCCRDPLPSVAISIIPRPDADDKLKAKLLAFQRQLTKIDNDELAKIFQDVSLFLTSSVPVLMLFRRMRQWASAWAREFPLLRLAHSAKTYSRLRFTGPM